MRLALLVGAALLVLWRVSRRRVIASPDNVYDDIQADPYLVSQRIGGYA